MRFFAEELCRRVPAEHEVVDTLNNVFDADLLFFPSPSLTIARYSDLLCVTRDVGLDYVHDFAVYRPIWCFTFSTEGCHYKDVDVEHLSVYRVHYMDSVSAILFLLRPFAIH